MLMFVRHNTDLSNILSGEGVQGALSYISDYITKMNLKDFEVLGLIATALTKIKATESINDPVAKAKTLLHKCLAGLIPILTFHRNDGWLDEQVTHCQHRYPTIRVSFVSYSLTAPARIIHAIMISPPFYTPCKSYMAVALPSQCRRCTSFVAQVHAFALSPTATEVAHSKLGKNPRMSGNDNVYSNVHGRITIMGIYDRWVQKH